ncbi:hypothetical protein KSP39_PZI024044 [Platanthera zijinensis]|uniref:Ubiquitin-like protease family profile domain-containing protein n=1 Tax=Platanthera zijinensis TaxID=2320716 RepID=A0AAP0FTN9_9ASPA
MPVHAPWHWCLLVCDLKRCIWDFYDSMSRGRHQGSLSSLVRAFHEDVSAALPPNILDWKILSVQEISKEDNEIDCGVSVLKYMEAALSPKEAAWKRKKGWQAEMPRFRAEITADILCVFHDLVATVSSCLAGLHPSAINCGKGAVLTEVPMMRSAPSGHPTKRGPKLSEDD